MTLIGAATPPRPERTHTMIAVSLTLILALLVGYYLTAGPTVEVRPLAELTPVEPTSEPPTEDTPEPNQPHPEDVKPEPSPTRPATLTTESELLLAPLGTIIRGPETWDFYPYTKCTADEWVGANETKRFTAKAEHMTGQEWTVLYMPGVGS